MRVGRIFVILLITTLLFSAGCARIKRVTIASNPDMATIYINGMEAGTTPIRKEFSFDNKKEIVVTAQKEGYKEASIPITFLPMEQKNYLITLEKLAKKVTITSSPDNATIFLDGGEIGRTPITRELSFKGKSASYMVSAQKEGYKDKTITIGLEPKELTDYHLVLGKLAKNVTVNSTPDGAKVYLDGAEIGNTPLNKEFLFNEKKEVTVIVKKEGYAEGNVVIGFNPPEQTEYLVELKQLTKKVTITSKPDVENEFEVDLFNQLSTWVRETLNASERVN